MTLFAVLDIIIFYGFCNDFLVLFTPDCIHARRTNYITNMIPTSVS
jgi:hypothetical protein